MALAEDKLLGKQRVFLLRCLLQPLVVTVQERPLFLRLPFCSLKFFLLSFRVSNGAFENIERRKS
jgi:hypothetical protein